MFSRAARAPREGRTPEVDELVLEDEDAVATEQHRAIEAAEQHHRDTAAAAKKHKLNASRGRYAVRGNTLLFIATIR